MESTFSHQNIVRVFAVLLCFACIGLPGNADGGVIPKPSQKCKKKLRNLNKGPSSFLRNKITGVSRVDYLKCYIRQLRDAENNARVGAVFTSPTAKSERIRRKREKFQKELKLQMIENRKAGYSGQWIFTIDVAPTVWSIYTLTHNKKTGLLTGSIQKMSGNTGTIMGAIDGKKGVTHENHPYAGGGVCDGKIVWKSKNKLVLFCDGVSHTGTRIE